MGWGYRDFVIERWGLGGVGLAYYYEDIEVLCTLGWGCRDFL